MKVQLFKGEGYGGGGLCWITVDKYEALALIQSLAEQLKTGRLNGGRLENRCKGAASEMSIVVQDENN